MCLLQIPFLPCLPHQLYSHNSQPKQTTATSNPYTNKAQTTTTSSCLPLSIDHPFKVLYFYKICAEQFKFSILILYRKYYIEEAVLLLLFSRPLHRCAPLFPQGKLSLETEEIAKDGYLHNPVKFICRCCFYTFTLMYCHTCLSTNSCNKYS